MPRRQNLTIPAFAAVVAVLTTLTLASAQGPKAAAKKPPSAPGAGARPNGAWSRLTTLITVRGKWLDERQFRKFKESDEPDDLLTAFAPQSARRLAGVALELGFDVVRQARDNPSQAIAIPGKNLDVSCFVQTTTHAGRRYHQPVFVVRRATARAPGLLPALPPGVPALPGLPVGLNP